MSQDDLYWNLLLMPPAEDRDHDPRDPSIADKFLDLVLAAPVAALASLLAEHAKAL